MRSHDYSRDRVDVFVLSRLARWLCKTRALSLTYCFSSNIDLMQIINHEISPALYFLPPMLIFFSLRTLKLDGNENVADSAIFTLTHGLPACTSTVNGPIHLRHLSLAECKNVTDAGVKWYFCAGNIAA